MLRYVRNSSCWALLLYGGALALWLCALPDRMLSDEHVHWSQVLRFAAGDWTVDPWLSTWPTMNALVSLPVRWLATQQLWVGRMTIACSAVLAFTGMLALQLAVQPPTVSKDQAALRALQFMLAPITLLFSILVYTDLPALAALLWAAFGAVTGRRALLLAAGAMTVALRQSHIVWLVALVLWFLHVQFRAVLDSRANQGAWAMVRTFVELTALRERTVLLTTLGLVALWTLIVQWSGGVAYGANTREGHFLHLAGAPNACFSMVVALIVFLPVYLNVLWLRRHAIGYQQIFVGALLLVLITLLFEATEPGNIHPAAQVLWRNRLLSLLQDPAGRVVMDVACLLGMYVSATMPVVPAAHVARIGALLFGVLYVLPFGLIEQRYYLPMLALLWSLRAPQSMLVEWVQLGWSVLLSVLLLQQVVMAGRFL